MSKILEKLKKVVPTQKKWFQLKEKSLGHQKPRKTGKKAKHIPIAGGGTGGQADLSLDVIHSISTVMIE